MNCKNCGNDYGLHEGPEAYCPDRDDTVFRCEHMDCVGNCIDPLRGTQALRIAALQSELDAARGTATIWEERAAAAAALAHNLASALDAARGEMTERQMKTGWTPDDDIIKLKAQLTALRSELDAMEIDREHLRSILALPQNKAIAELEDRLAEASGDRDGFEHDLALANEKRATLAGLLQRVRERATSMDPFTEAEILAATTKKEGDHDQVQ